jgi:hypothetical protein
VFLRSFHFGYIFARCHPLERLNTLPAWSLGQKPERNLSQSQLKKAGYFKQDRYH